MQNEGAQEAVCEDRVREVERLMMMRDSPKCETDAFEGAAGRLTLNSQCGGAIPDRRGLR